MHATARYQTIISLVPSWTEFISKFVDIERIVGRTDYCILPPKIKDVPAIGGTKNPDIDMITKLEPDLVIANKEENKQVDINQLRASGINVFTTGAVTVQEAIEEMAYLEYILTQSITYSQTVKREVGKVRDQTRYTFVYLVWNDPIMIAGPQTYINHVITKAGGRNIWTRTGSRYPKVDVENLIELQPDYLFLPDEPYEFTTEDKTAFQEIFEETKVILVDGKLASWYGTRITDALTFFESLDPGYSKYVQEQT